MRETDQHQELLDDIVEDFTQRLRSGERPAINEYSNRHPEMRDEIEELLTSVAMIEELKTQPESQADSIKKEMREICRLSRIGDYRIVRELGRGGMGIVFEAVHESLGRRVAIKVMPNRTFDDEKYLERFKREAHAAANLHHTNIVSVFGMGQAGDHRYYVMEFVDGMSLSEILTEINRMSSGATQHGNTAETLTDQVPAPVEGSMNGKPEAFERKRLPPIRTTFKSPKDRFRWAAKLGMQIADGLAYAHGMGMLHRDIKPANLLVDRFETVWLTDFGLVKNISNQSITKSGDIIGTPQYMAPEAFEGTYDERSETYCLGLNLYEMVTLQPAYENASTPELIRRITTTSPVPPRKIDPRIPRDLSRIIQKATSREPSYRYETAAGMRNDLLAFLEDRPIEARKISMTENLYRWGRRNPLAATLALLTGLMVFCVAVISTVFLDISNRRVHALEVEQTRLKVEKRIAVHETSRANKNLEVLSDWLDHMFLDLVLKDVPKDTDISLDGFDQLRGISTTVNETDAEFLSRMLEFYEWFIDSTKTIAYSSRASAIVSGKQTGLDPSSNESDKAIAQGNAAQILPDVRARSHRRIGNIYHLSGEVEKAIEAYDQAISIYEDQLKSESKSLPLRIKLARVLNEKGQALEMQGMWNSRRRAIEQYQKAEAYLRDRIDVGDPAVKTSGREIHLELAKTLTLIGSPQNKPPVPRRFQEEIRWRGPMNSRGSAEPMTRLRNWFQAKDGKREGLLPEDSMTELQKALATVSKLTKTTGPAGSVKVARKDVDTLLLKANILTRMAVLQPTIGKNGGGGKFPSPEDRIKNRELSKKYRDQALEIVVALREDEAERTKNLVESDAEPRLKNNPEFLFTEALIRSTPVGPTTRETVNDLKRARRLLEKLTRDYERNYEYRKLLAEVSLRLGRIYKNRNDQVNAELNLRTASRNTSQLLQEAPRNMNIQRAALVSLWETVDLLLDSDQNDEAEKLVRESVEVMEELADSKKRMPSYFQLALAIRYGTLARVYRESGNTDAAVLAREKAMNAKKNGWPFQREALISQGQGDQSPIESVAPSITEFAKLIHRQFPELFELPQSRDEIDAHRLDILLLA